MPTMKTTPRGCSKPRFGIIGVALLVGLGAPSGAFAHGGEIEVGSGGARGPVELSATQQSATIFATTNSFGAGTQNIGTDNKALNAKMHHITSTRHLRMRNVCT